MSGTRRTGRAPLRVRPSRVRARVSVVDVGREAAAAAASPGLETATGVRFRAAPPEDCAYGEDIPCVVGARDRHFHFGAAVNAVAAAAGRARENAIRSARPVRARPPRPHQHLRRPCRIASVRSGGRGGEGRTLRETTAMPVLLLYWGVGGRERNTLRSSGGTFRPANWIGTATRPGAHRKYPGYACAFGKVRTRSKRDEKY